MNPLTRPSRFPAGLSRPSTGAARAILASLAMLLAPVDGRGAEDAGELIFVRRVAPLFSEKCLACHGDDPKKLKGGYDMRTRESALRGGDSEQAAVIPGKAGHSPLLLAIARDHADWEPMPPKEADALNEQQRLWVREWIMAGAPWPEAARMKELAEANAGKWSAEDGVPMPTSGGLSPEWTNRKYKPDGLWAYRPVQKPVLPASALHPIDALLAAKIPAGLTLAPPSDARTFIRRASFDLTGLPPTPEEVEAFVQESEKAGASVAISGLIERLLASPHYGERMAQHWLDVTRYADSGGFANDYERGNAWRYRDYVVRAFNSDKRYDQLTREQLAGDELRPDDPEMLIATGFLRMGPWELTSMEVARVARQRFLDDVTNAVGETFLAHSLQCARCHDHKFDPVPTRDYYAIQAVFATTQLAERTAPFLPEENVAGFDERKYLEAQRAEHLAMLRTLDEKLVRNAERWFGEKRIDAARWHGVIEKAREAGSQRGGKRREFSGAFDAARAAMARAGVPEDQYPPKLVGFAPEDFGNERVARKGLERLRWELERYEPFALAVYDGRTPDVKAIFAPVRVPAGRLNEGELEQPCIRTGGDPFAEGMRVTPGVLSVIGAAQKTAIPAEIEGRRRAFAEWVASAENPLTTRAIVNRVWLWHFGQPLAGNPNNFGSTGGKPANPELLDWLAASFVEQGWSFKALHRVIMTSEAYRRGALHPNLAALQEKDPAGLSYAVFKPRRLTAEELRDAMLAATGELNRTLGGIPNRPEINLEAALQPRQVMGTFAAAWTPNPRPEQRHRRSLYALKLRGLPDPAMEVFNAPAPDFSCERREASTVTPQAFSLFNGRASHARALVLATRALKETSNDEAAIGRAFALAFSRAPNAEEVQRCLTHWREIEALAGAVATPFEKLPREVRRDAVEENTGEKFSFQEKLHAAADFIPDLQAADVLPHTRALADICLVLLNSNEFAYVY